MDRRKFLTAAAVTAATSALSTPALSQNRRQWRLITAVPRNLPALGTVPQWFADKVTAATGGRIEVKLYAAGEVVPAFESIDAVADGTAQIGHGAPYYWKGKLPAMEFLANFPFGLTAQEMNAFYFYGGGDTIYDEAYAQMGCKFFPGGNVGVQMGGWFNKEINSLDDYKGLKMRIPGLGGEVLRRIGASALTLPGGEIFPSLQSGAIDATEWVGPWNDLAFGFYKVTKFYYYPGFHEPGSTLSCGMNLDVWNSLSADHKAIVSNACLAENNRMLSEFNAKNSDALETLITKHNVKLRRQSDSILRAIGVAADEVMAEVGSTDDISKRVYKSFMDFRAKAMGWTSLSETAYAAARALDKKLGY